MPLPPQSDKDHACIVNLPCQPDHTKYTDNKQLHWNGVKEVIFCLNQGSYIQFK